MPCCGIIRDNSVGFDGERRPSICSRSDTIARAISRPFAIRISGPHGLERSDDQSRASLAREIHP